MATRNYQVVDDAGDIVVAADGSVVIVEETWSWTKAARAAGSWTKRALASVVFTKASRPSTTWTKDEITD